MRRSTTLAVLLALLLCPDAVLRAADSTPPLPEQPLRSSRLLSVADPSILSLDETWRRGQWDRSQGMLPPRDRGEGARFVSDGNALAPRAAARWLGAPPPLGAELPLGFRFDVDLQILAFATDPHRQLHPVYLDVRAGETVDPAWRARLGFWADAQLAKGLSAHLRFVFDSEAQNDPHNRTPDFDQLGASNNLDQSYLRYLVGPAAFTLGRRFLNWGPSGEGSLILSPLAPAMDMLHAELAFGKHRLQAFVGRLSSETAFIPTLIYDPDTGTTQELEIETTLSRHVYGHRLELTLWSWGNLGLSEVALVAQSGGGIDLGYLNPVGIHVVNETEQSGGDGDGVNLLHQVDAEAWFGGWHLYGAFLVDDYQIDSQPREVWPDQLAGSIGVDRRLGESIMLSYEYRYLGSWTYLHRGAGTRIRQFGRPLGAPEGPDMDRNRLLVSWRPVLGARLWASGEYRRRGINRIDTAESREGHAGESYPRPPVESRWVASLGGEWSTTPWLRAEAFVAYHAIDQMNNLDLDEDIVEFRASLHLFGPALRFLLGGG